MNRLQAKIRKKRRQRRRIVRHLVGTSITDGAWFRNFGIALGKAMFSMECSILDVLPKADPDKVVGTPIVRHIHLSELASTYPVLSEIEASRYES